MKPMIETPKSPMAERVVYTDAAGRPKIIAAVAFGPSKFTIERQIDSIWSLKTGYRRKPPFAKTCYIYGLDMLAVLALLMQNHTYYVSRC